MEIIGFNLLNTSIATLTFFYVLLCLGMIFLILLQRPKQEGLGAAFGASTAGEIFGSRVTSVLQRGTVYLASGFFLLTLILGILIQRRNSASAKIERAEAALVETPVQDPVKSIQAEVPENPVGNQSTTITTQNADANATQPEGTPVQPEGTPVQPKGAPMQPEGAPVQPEGALVQPEGTPVQPEGTPAQPQGNPQVKEETKTPEDSSASPK